MEFPGNPGQRVFLDLVEMRRIDLASESKERASLLPQSHCEEAFRSAHHLKLCNFPSINFTEIRDVLLEIYCSSSKIEVVLYMIEAHSL